MLAESSKNDSSINPIPLKSSSKDELFIDDETDTSDVGDTDKLDADEMMLGEEGSGMGPPSKGTGAEDMESSGSGYGPDDEDAAVSSGKTKGKPGLDSEEDDIDDEDEEDEDNDDFDKQKVDIPATVTTTSTSTTTTTTENYDEESRIIELVCLFSMFSTPNTFLKT